MRAPRVKTQLLLLLLTTLTWTAFCEDGETVEETAGTVIPGEEISEEDGSGISSTTSLEVLISPQTPTLPLEFTTENNGISTNMAEGGTPDDPPDMTLIYIVIPLVLVAIIIAMIACGIFICRRMNRKVKNKEMNKQDQYLDDSSTEKVPMPMFEEDVPSVLELEMHELDQWMKKDGADDFKDV
ncbi:transmembrane protein 154 isoform 2-T2 [Pholidichthys leucotaenia]